MGTISFRIVSNATGSERFAWGFPVLALAGTNAIGGQLAPDG